LTAVVYKRGVPSADTLNGRPAPSPERAAVPVNLEELRRRQIEVRDGRVDALLYELYRLTDGEKMIVEERTREIWL